MLLLQQQVIETWEKELGSMQTKPKAIFYNGFPEDKQKLEIDSKRQMECITSRALLGGMVSLQIESSFLPGNLHSEQQPKGSENVSGELGSDHLEILNATDSCSPSLVPWGSISKPVLK